MAGVLPIGRQSQHKRVRSIYNAGMMTTARDETTPSADARLDELRAWLEPHFGDIQLQPASADASFRRYFRIHHGDQSYIVMDAPPEQEDSRPFVDIAARLAAAGLHVPTVLAQDLDRGFLLLSDLGGTSYLQALDEANADELFADAIEALITMQLGAEVRGLPLYDHALLMQELRLFPDWFLESHLDITLSAAETAALETIFTELVDRALDQRRVFVHRDYMPRNLMVSRPNPGILDFQDAVAGPVSYDAICLFKDAFISWPQTRVAGWLAQYWQQARMRGVPVPADWQAFQMDLDWMGVQRHLKVLGIFARICHRDGKPHYLADTPRFVEYVMQVIPQYPVLAPLGQLFEERVKPAMSARAAN